MPTDDRWSPAPPDGYVPPTGRPLPEQRGGRVYGSPRAPQGPPQGPPPQGPPQAPPQQAPPSQRPLRGAPPRVPRQPVERRPLTDRPPLTDPRPPLDPRPMIEPRPPIKTGRRRPRRRGPWLIVIVAVIGLALIAAGLRFVPGSPFASTRASGTRGTGAAGSGGRSTETTPSPTLAPLPFRSAAVTVPLRPNEFMSWALLDRRTGEIVGSSNMAAASQTTASMVKAWLAADYLRRADENGRTPSDSQLHTVEIMIRDSDNNAAVTIYNANGKTASIQRLIQRCGLTDSRATSGEWSRTYISARDTVRYGDCIADGRAAGEKWTPWLLDMMRKVRGEGDFGPRKALPPAVAATVAIKNGWLVRDETKPLIWHVSCMAIGDTWVLAVLQRYLPTNGYTPDLIHLGNTAADIARQLLNPEAG